MLCVVGDLVEDVVVRLSGPPERGTDTPVTIDRRRGGSAANVAVAAAAAGAPTRFVGRVGDDPLADQLVDALTDAGVETYVQRGRGRTGSVVVLVEPDGERTMLPDRGAAAELASVDESWLDGVTWLHAPAYSLCGEPIGTATAALVRHVQGRWGRVSVDVSSVAVVRAFGIDAFVELLRRLAPDVVFANRAEAALLHGWAPPLLVVKQGADPIELITDGGRREVVLVAPIGAVDDTTGAGDAFAGGFISAMMRGDPPIVAAAAGAAAAAAALVAIVASE